MPGSPYFATSPSIPPNATTLTSNLTNLRAIFDRKRVLLMYKGDGFTLNLYLDLVVVMTFEGAYQRNVPVLKEFVNISFN